MPFLDSAGLQYIAEACNKKYLQLSGGEMSGQIKYSGTGEYIKSRDVVAVSGTGSGLLEKNDWHPVVGQKSQSGYWAMGTIPAMEDLCFLYTTDANYEAGTNSYSNVRIPVPAKESTVAFTSNIGNGRITIKAAGESKGSFTLNQSENAEINIDYIEDGAINQLFANG